MIAQAVKEMTVSNPVEALILDLLEWIGPRPRAYSEVIEAWRTSCPRLPVWEEANELGLVKRHFQAGRGVCVSVTELGSSFLESYRPPRPAPRSNSA
jgi:hypothetical protein